MQYVQKYINNFLTKWFINSDGFLIKQYKRFIRIIIFLL
jgi:hypothetical protein